MAKKKSLFSTRGQYGIKFNGKYGKLNAAERGALIMEQSDLNKKLTSRERMDVNAYIKYRKQDLQSQLTQIPSADAKKYIATQVAEDFGINISDTELSEDMFNDMESAMQQYMEQEQVYNTLAQDRRYINAAKEEPDKYENLAKALEEDDKWRLLRKLAEVDKRLNYDRAYASETLKEIEDIMNYSEYKTTTFDEVFDILVEQHQESIQQAEKWADDLHPFSDDYDVQSKALVSNKGFHGVDKAMSKYFKHSGNSVSLSDYSPAYFEI